MKKSILSTAIASMLSLGVLLNFAPDARGEGEDAFRESVLRDPEIPAIGNPQGDLTIVEYFDYQCPYCKKVAPELVKIAREDGKLRIVLKDWPIFGGVSQYAARMVLAAKYQNKYQEAHAALIGATTKLSEEVNSEICSKARVSMSTRATSDMDTNKSCHRGSVGPQQRTGRGIWLPGNACLHRRDIQSTGRAGCSELQTSHR